MKNRLRVYFILFSITIGIHITSCQNETDESVFTKNFSQKTLTIQEDKLVKLHFDKFISPEITKVYPKKNIAFIYDHQKTELYAFNLKGNYLTSFGSYGEAPYQFKKISDVELTTDNKIIVYCPTEMKLNFYHLDGSFIKYEKLNTYGSGIEILEGNFYLNTDYSFSELSGTNLVLRFDQNFKLLNKGIPLPESPGITPGISGFFEAHANKNHFYFNYALSDTLHIISPDLTVKKSIIVSEVEKTWPHEYKYRKILEDPNMLNYSYIISEPRIYKDLVMLPIINNRFIYNHIFDFTNGIRFKSQPKELYNFLSNYLVSVSSQSNTFYVLLTDETFLHAKSSGLSKEINKDEYPKLHKLFNSADLKEGTYLYSFTLN